MNKPKFSKLFLSLCAAGFVSQASAEQLVLEEVIVTAQKRAESLQDAPIAISAFNSESIQELGAFNAVDLGEYMPNVSISQTFGSSNNIRVNIRGIGSGEPSLTIDPKVGIYVDGVYIARNAGAVFDIVDLEMIEVLRGPQGTLWGKNTTGGAVNIRTKKPKGELGFNQLLSVGNDGYLRSTSSLDTPALGPVSAKLTYMKKDYDGWATNINADAPSDLGSDDTDAYRLAIHWDISDNITLDYAYDRTESESVPIPFQITHLGPGADANLIGTYNLKTAQFFGGLNILDDMRSVLSPNERVETFNLDGIGPEEVEIQGHSLTLSWDMGPLEVKSITALREYESDVNGTDLDGGAWTGITGGQTVATPVFHTSGQKEQEQVSQEIQFIGEALDSKLNYVVGLYYFQEEGQEHNPWNAIYYVPGRPVLLGGLDSAAGAWYSMDSESKAIFTHFNYFISDSFSSTLGLRYTQDDKEVTLLADDPRIAENHTASADWSKFTFDLTLQWQPSDDLNVYFKYAQGFNAGVFSIGALDHAGQDYSNFTVFDIPADPEEVDSFELGMKSQWFDNRVRLNAAVFYNANDNLQLTEFINGVRTVRNSGENETQGFEVDLIALLSETISLDASWGVVKTNIIGNNGRDKAKHSARAGIGYYKPLNGFSVKARFDTTYTDAQHFSGSVWGNAGSRTLHNARFGLTDIALAGGMLTVDLWGKNLGDKVYRAYGADLGTETGFGYAGNSFGAPRSYGIDFVYDF